jgi:hypothetical protein
VQEFHYIPDAQAAELRKEKEAERLSKAAGPTPIAQGKAENGYAKQQ